MKAAACGEMHSLLLSNSGMVFFFGFNSTAKANSDTEKQTTPESIEDINSAVFISAGTAHNAVVVQNIDATSDLRNEVYTWGKGWDYQLGNQKRTNLSFPRRVEFNRKFHKICYFLIIDIYRNRR